MQKITIKKAHELMSMQLYVAKGQTLPDLEKCPDLKAAIENIKQAWVYEGMQLAKSTNDTIRMAMSRDSEDAKHYREAIAEILKNGRRNDLSINVTLKQLNDLEKKLQVPIKMNER